MEQKEWIVLRKFYTETQYNYYSDLMDRMANEDDIQKNYQIHLEIKQWIAESRISNQAIEQMDQRMLEEDMQQRPRLTRIK